VVTGASGGLGRAIALALAEAGAAVAVAARSKPNLEETAREIDPLMGWTSSSDMRQQIELEFATAEEAVAYCERHGIPYQVFEPKRPARRAISYSDNFAFKRREPWTH